MSGQTFVSTIQIGGKIALYRQYTSTKFIRMTNLIVFLGDLALMEDHAVCCDVHHSTSSELTLSHPNFHHHLIRTYSTSS